MIIKSFTHIIDKSILQKLILIMIKDSFNLGMVVVAVIILLRCVISFYNQCRNRLDAGSSPPRSNMANEKPDRSNCLPSESHPMTPQPDFPKALLP